MDKYSVYKIKFHKSYEPVGEYDYSKKCPFNTLDSQGFIIPVGSRDCERCEYYWLKEKHNYTGEEFVWCGRKLLSFKGTIKRIKLWFKKILS